MTENSHQGVARMFPAVRHMRDLVSHDQRVFEQSLQQVQQQQQLQQQLQHRQRQQQTHTPVLDPRLIKKAGKYL